MSDGFVTVAQCVEGLPLGRFVWELLFCAMLTWFLLGAINDSTAVALGNSSEEPNVALLAAALALGNFLAVLVGGWMADRYGRTAVIRPALLLTLSSGMVLQSARTLSQAMVARFVLGIVSGALISVVPALVAELLPAKHRGFYLTIWCCGWPAGALLALLAGSLSPDLNSRAFFTTLAVPAIIVYICLKADMIPESPRYLYLVGRREEGYSVLLDMYDREDLLLPWPAESIAVTCAPLPKQEAASSSSTTGAPTKAAPNTSTAVAVWLGAAMFLISAAAQSVKIWMPALLRMRSSGTAAAAGAMSMSDSSAFVGATLPANLRGPAGDFDDLWTPRTIIASLLGQAGAFPPVVGGGAHAAVVSLLSAAPPHVVEHGGSGRSHLVPLILAQAYAVQLLGVVLCAYASMWVRRKQLVQWSLPLAAIFMSLTLCAAQAGYILLSGPLLGLQLAAQSCSVNFLQAFAAEHFPTCRRAKVVAGVVFASQLGDFLMPIFGVIVIERMPRIGAVLFFSGLYILAWIVSYRLPLPTFKERSLHDVDEPRCPKEVAARNKRREFANYQAI